MTQSQASLTLPMRLENLTLFQVIGAGAMGEVYLARESVTDRELAVKVLGPGLVANQRAITRFRREISAMGQLRHPGVPAFAGYGDLPDGRPYMAMEYLRGHTLDAFVRDGRPLPENLALWVVTQIVEILAYCNREVGMIHRDLKPSNVMVDLAGQSGLCERSRLRIIDFGLASFIDFGDFEDFSIGQRARAGGTMVGEVVGTPAFMSPEQIRGQALTFHSDIYAVGCILYNLLTGRMPYTGPSPAVVMAAHLDSPVPDPGSVVELRSATVALVQRAMAKSAQARYRSYEQFLSSLQAARFVTTQAIRRQREPNPAAGSSERTTIGTDVMPRPPTTSWRRTEAPAQPPPPGSSGTSAWSRPRPVAAPPPPPPPAAPAAEEYPATPAPEAPAPASPTQQPISTSRWKRPVRTPPPTP